MNKEEHPMKESMRMKTLDFSVAGPYVLCAVTTVNGLVLILR